VPYLLFYSSPHEHHKVKWSWIVDWAGLYGVHPIAVDLIGEFRQTDRPPFHFRSLADALASPVFHGHTWVWLDAQASVYLDEFEHPADRVVYCIGEDFSGFQDLDAEGPRIRLRPFNSELKDEAEYWPQMVATAVLHDRAMYLAGRRRS